MIGKCLENINFADEIIVLDQNSKDSTSKIAKKYTSRVLTSKTEEFDVNRNFLKSEAKSEWLLYIDADERIDNNLASEIKQAIIDKKCAAYYFPRKNFILGKWLKNGGWWPDYVPKLFQRSALIGWQGAVHESPQVRGKFGYFKNPLNHYTARDISSMLKKSIKWANIEAGLFFKAKSSRVNSPRIVKAMVIEFTRRYFVKRGFLDGTVGLIEAIYQSLHQAIILTYLWEIQNNSIKKAGKFSNE